MEKKELSVEEFLKNRYDLSEICGGCRFFKINLDQCREKNITVQYETPKCEKWRYFA
jgi:hypothetical protein